MSGSTSIRAPIGEWVDTFLCTLSESAPVTGEVLADLKNLETLSLINCRT